MVNCCVPCCKQHDRGKAKDGVSFHEFPSDLVAREKWLKNIKRKDWTPVGRSFVCSKHFLTNDFIIGKIKRLKRDAVPSIFEGYPGYLQKAAQKITPRKPPSARKPIPKKVSAEKKSKQSSTCELTSVATALSENNSMASYLESCSATITLTSSMGTSEPESLSSRSDSPLLDFMDFSSRPTSCRSETVTASDVSFRPTTLLSSASKESEFSKGSSGSGSTDKGRPKLSPRKLLKERAHYLKMQNHLTHHNGKLQSALNKTVESLSQLKSERQMWNLPSIIQDANDGQFKAIFLVEQLKNYKNRKPRWNENIIRNSLIWRMKHPRSYEYCRQHIIELPSQSTLQRYVGGSSGEVGVTTLI